MGKFSRFMSTIVGGILPCSRPFRCHELVGVLPVHLLLLESSHRFWTFDEVNFENTWFWFVNKNVFLLWLAILRKYTFSGIRLVVSKRFESFFRCRNQPERSFSNSTRLTKVCPRKRKVNLLQNLLLSQPPNQLLITIWSRGLSQHWKIELDLLVTRFLKQLLQPSQTTINSHWIAHSRPVLNLENWFK